MTRSGAAPGPVELIESSLNGDVHANGNSIHFQYRSTAVVTVAGAEMTILSGNAALNAIPADPSYRTRSLS
jgi:hypothetical protein